jgi:hypothetical protein
MKVEISDETGDQILIEILKNIRDRHDKHMGFWKEEPEYYEKLKDAVNVVLDYFGETP